MYDEGSDTGPKGTFEIYKAEADALYKQGEYRKAIESYTTALELQTGDKNCLVCRSRCNLQLGDTEKALADAEASLADDKTFHKGLYQKAQALYYKGDFEMALVFYHRGHKLRPELEEFRLGIQKAQEAIDNSVGSAEKVKLTTEGDLSFFHVLDEKQKKRKPAYGSMNRQAAQQSKQKRQESRMTNEKTVKQLLGELYGDRQYLEKLLKETDPISDTGKTISDLVEEGLSYLDTRTDFWRQQKPMYARKHEKNLQRRGRDSGKGLPNDYIIKELERIDASQGEGKYKESLKRSQKCLLAVENFTEEQVPNKTDVICNLHSCIGNAYLELGRYSDALSHHQMDLTMGENYDLEDAISRGLDNLGRVHARSGQYKKAIQIWERKLPLSKSPLESTWLHHEIGRCYLELESFQSALECGEKSLSAAEEADDIMWCLQATVLMAQSQVKLSDNQGALSSFEKSLDLAKLQGDNTTESAIQKAIEDVNSKIVQEIKEQAEKEKEDERLKEQTKNREDKNQDEAGDRTFAETTVTESYNGDGEVSEKGSRKEDDQMKTKEMDHDTEEGNES